MEGGEGGGGDNSFRTLLCDCTSCFLPFVNTSLKLDFEFYVFKLIFSVCFYLFILHMLIDIILMQYSKFVKPAFDDFILPTKKYADIIIPRGGDNHVAIDLIVQHIRTKLGQHDLCKIYPNLYVIHSTFQVSIPLLPTYNLVNYVTVIYIFPGASKSMLL